MKKTLLFIASILFYTAITAQSVYKENDLDKYISKTSIPKNTDGNVSGSPYINDTFGQGIIEKDGIALVHNIGLRYNANKDYFEVKKNIALKDNQAQLLVRTNEITVLLDNNEYTFVPANTENMIKGYFIVLESGKKVSLYKKINKSFIPGQKAYSSMTRPVAPMYKEKIVLYLYSSDGILTELPTSKKGKLKAFNKNHKELKSFLKENKLNLNKEKDLIKLTNYYNTI